MKRNIGVAIAIPPPFGPQLEVWREEFGDPAAHLISAHITLLPPTAVGDVPAVVDHLSAVAGRHDQFGIALRGTGTFRPVSPVVYVRVSDGDDRIVTLESDVRSGPLARSLRFDFHPHVTVAHDVPDATLTRAQQALADYRADFDAEAITLYEQGPGGMWSPLEDFPLRAGG